MMSENKEKTVPMISTNRYESLDGLRAISALCIVALHLYSNFGYTFDNFLFSNIISSLGMLTLLFMMLSGFSMCCGYYEKILSGSISITNFYEKRYAKILPFFALLTIIDILVAPSTDSIYEGFANLTLSFGLLPNANIQVIGMGWTLGTIFAFYMLFPFFCFLIKNTRMAWFSLGISVIYHYLCSVYFFDNNHVLENYWSPQNIIFCAMFFIAGGVIYLYRTKLQSFVIKWHCFMLLFCIVLTVIYYTNIVAESFKDYYLLILFSAWLIYGLNSNNIVLNNPIAKFISGTSMEIYLAHMFIFRIIEKLNLKYIFGKNIFSYITTYCLTIVLTISFSLIVKWMFNKLGAAVQKKHMLQR